MYSDTVSLMYYFMTNVSSGNKMLNGRNVWKSTMIFKNCDGNAGSCSFRILKHFQKVKLLQNRCLNTDKYFKNTFRRTISSGGLRKYFERRTQTQYMTLHY